MEDRHATLPKPAYRGLMHKYAFFASIPCALFLVLSSSSSTTFWTMTVYGFSLMGLFGVSALYHRTKWKTLETAKRMGKLDRTMIYIFITSMYQIYCSYYSFEIARKTLVITLIVLIIRRNNRFNNKNYTQLFLC